MVVGQQGAVKSWPLAPTPGGWTLGAETQERDGQQVPVPAVYMGAQAVIKRVGMSRAFYELRRRDAGLWVTDPAVLIGDIPGWVEDDVVGWGIDCGLLLEDGEIPADRLGRSPGQNVRAARKRLAEPLQSWRRETRVYLGVADLAAGLGISEVGITSRSLRGVLLAETVRIPSAKPDWPSLRGWSEPAVRRWSPQMGYTWQTPDYVTAAIEREEQRRKAA